MSLTPYSTNLPADLRALKAEIEGYARGYGLDFYETIFEVIDADDLNEIAAYGGFPTRYPHWSFGMAYEELKKGYDYGLSKIYEMVINNDPCYAYLMRCNHTVDQKLVMAHVYGHCDFFKNNAYFAHTSRKMMDEMANHGARLRRYVEKYGEDEVESFVDRCMSIDDLIDVHSTAIPRRENTSRYDDNERAATDPKPTRRARLNPYKLGIELFRDIEHRWNTGKFGKEYDDCDDLDTRRKWDKQLGLGRKKIFEVRRVHNDITFIETYLTEDFCREHKMFAYAFQDQTGQ